MPRRLILLAIAIIATCCGLWLYGRERKLNRARTELDRVQKAIERFQAESPSSPIRFRVQRLPFQYEPGESRLKLPVETTGGGVGLVDYDSDGDLDLFFCQGGDPLKPIQDTHHADVLLRNHGNGRFTDVSLAAGITPKGYGQGVAIADYDGDGDPDIYVTRYQGNTLWRNNGDGTFTDVTEQAGVKVGLWSVGAAFFDLEGDGDLDLFVANYFDFDPAKAPFDHDNKTGEPMYGFPANFDGQPDSLFRNNGDGTFTDISAASKLAGKGRGMGVLAADLDDDGKVDLLVANDAQANAVWRNLGDATFEDKGLEWGLALNGEGAPEANMGIAHGDADGDSFEDILITHFYDERATFWHKLGGGPSGTFFQDRTNEAGLVVETKPLTGWGVAFADFDDDGALDLIMANGHIRPETHLKYRLACPQSLFRNQGGGRFVNVGKSAGAYFEKLAIGRGLAVGDLDNDGDLDAVIVHYGEPAAVLWNETPAQGRRITIKLIGKGGNRDAIGARVSVKAGGRTWVQSRDGGGGYISAGDPRLHFGLGSVQGPVDLEITWPDGSKEKKPKVTASELTLEQSR